nr:uncharacterized protein LOC106625754 isoform X2 [Bactrocera oleae]
MLVLLSLLDCPLIRIYTSLENNAGMCTFDQLQICMEAIVDMKLVINKWNRHIEEETSLTARIPLSSLDQIERLNAEINNDNCECKDYEITF